ncbi:MAG: hypothetical protein ACD_73C00144G0003 [uncultured bacterium]|nr:MAG: hypothetical protein ACD_73C00144G0003 [uncultured bacterium]
MIDFQPYWAIPFGLILLSIALFPLLAAHFWEKNKNKLLVMALLAGPVLFLLIFNSPHLLEHSILEYISFVILLASLFIISGGIHLSGDLKATPSINTLFLGVGALLASLIGTTGASMLLIRPLLQTNSERHHTKHLPLFFIFIVSNLGGLLTPIGDPPLFLGFLRGVPFFWTLKLFPIWAISISYLLLLFFIVDKIAYQKETVRDVVMDNLQVAPLKITGSINFLLLIGVIGSVFLPTPYRELVMVLLALLSYRLTPKDVHERNSFNFGPIIEVAILFAGIFIAMVPALQILKIHGPEFGIIKPAHFYWLSGALSSFLDNAPTYLTFFSMAGSLPFDGTRIAGVPEIILEAISCGAVMMGANSYIGNGPNFMVKAIADSTGLTCPSFFGYIFYAAIILFPLYGLITFLFF